MSGDETHAEQGVRVEVEVARLNLSLKGVLVVTTLSDHRGVHRLPHSWLRPGEDPVEAARRTLVERCGIDTVHHDPLFIGHHVHPDRQDGVPTLTLSFAVLGPVPSSSATVVGHLPFADIRGATGSAGPAIDHPDIVVDARAAVGALLENTTLALRLLGKHEAKFRLQELFAVYRGVLGDDIDDDMTNFRRKVEGADDFVRWSDPPAHAVKSRGRPARWYEPGDATRLNPPIRFRRASRTTSPE